MRFAQSEPEIPTWLAGVIVLLVTASFAYGVVVLQSLIAVVMVWLWMLGIVLSVFVVYLLYRFVVAVEQIADKI